MKYILKDKAKIAAVTALDALGYPFSFFKGPRAPISDPASFLVVRLDHIGDVLASTGVPKILKEHFPKSKVYFLTSGWGAPLVRGNPFIDEVWLYDAPWFRKKNYKAPQSMPGFWDLARKLRAQKIEVGLGLRGDLRENLLMAAAGIRERIGYGVTGGGFLLTREMPYSARAHESARTLNLLRPLGIQTQSLVPQVYFKEGEKEAFRAKLAEWKLENENFIVGLQLEAGTEAKEWPEAHAIEFLKNFFLEFRSAKVVLVGTDAERAANFTQRCAHPFLINLAGRTTLREFALLCGHFKLFVGPDSGPAHLALAQGVRTVVLYSGTNVYEDWKPLSEQAVTLRKEVPCAPCGLQQCSVPGHPCMTTITPEELLKTVKESL